MARLFYYWVLRRSMSASDKFSHRVRAIAIRAIRRFATMAVSLFINHNTDRRSCPMVDVGPTMGTNVRVSQRHCRIIELDYTASNVAGEHLKR